MIGVGYRNSLIYVVLGTTINLIMTCLCAYPLSKKRLVGRKFVMLLIVFTMFFSGGLIPTYLLVRALGMVNSIWALFIPDRNRRLQHDHPAHLLPVDSGGPGGVGVSWTARGGGGSWPASSCPSPRRAWPRSACSTPWAHWNSYFSALIYLNDAEKYPLPMIVREIVLQEVVLKRQELAGDAFDAEREARYAAYTQNFRYATVFVSIIPMLIIYPFVQRYLVQGLMIGSLKE